MKLSDKKIASAKPKEKPYRLSDGGALYLEVTPRGNKLWRYRYRIEGKQGIYSIGQYYDERIKPPDHVSLEQARIERSKARALVKTGQNPTMVRDQHRLVRREEGKDTFEAVAREWIAQNKPRWVPYYLQQVENFMGSDVFPHIGGFPIKSITPAQILAILKRVEARGAETVALQLRQWCSAVFRYAIDNLRAEADPAGVLKRSVKRPEIKHKTPLTEKQVGEIARKLDALGVRPTALALRLLLFFWVRPSELREAEWKEFDLDAAEWNIPASRMKMSKPHAVPLSRQSIELLRKLQKISGSNKYLFPNYLRPDDCMGRTTLNRSLERLGYGGTFSAHAFRATASTLLNKAGFNRDWIEIQLAHSPKDKIRAIYNQYEYFKERRQMMQQWADMVDAWTADNTVVTGKFGKAVA